MLAPGYVGLIFLAIALVYTVGALRRPRSAVARKAWLRVAVIFAIVGLALQLLPALLR